MALEPIVLEILLREAAKPRANRGRILSLGYPDMLAMPGQLDDVPETADAGAVKAWHHWPHRVPDAARALDRLGIDLRCVDVATVRGGEIITDLNTEKWRPGNFDIVLDPGTSEHVFNIGNAFAFIAGACVTGGLVIHTNPLNMGNHGFWSINPAAYVDWYEANGFEIEQLGELSGPVSGRKVRPVSLIERFDASPNSSILCAARKVRDVPLCFPIQSKYRLNPTLKGAA